MLGKGTGAGTRMNRGKQELNGIRLFIRSDLVWFDEKERKKEKKSEMREYDGRPAGSPRSPSFPFSFHLGLFIISIFLGKFINSLLYFY
jgi:hypothetical protein